jgi:GR25 family glycosyltransferase involved in LPS biosynthesis
VPACDGKDLTLEMIYSLFPVLNKDEINKFQPWIYITEKRKIVEYKNKDFWKCIKNYKIKNFSKIRPAGHVGCAYSHLTILKDALDSDYQNILILEDDFVIVKDPHLLGDLVNEADLEIGAGNWDIIYLDNWHEGLKRGKFHFWMRSYPYPHFQSQDPKKFEERQSTSKNIDRIFARHATHSMILSKNGIKKIYSHFLEYKFFYPIDVDLFNIPGINIFQSKNDYITTDKLTSDTANTD